MLVNKLLIIFYCFFGQIHQEIEIGQKIAVAPMIYEEAYEYADIIYTEYRTVTVLWRFDSFGTLQPFVAHIQYQESEPKPVICRNADEYPEVVIVYNAESCCIIQNKNYLIDVFRYCPIKREIRQIVLKDNQLRIPQISGVLKNVVAQNFQDNIDNVVFTKELSDIYSENLGFEP